MHTFDVPALPVLVPAAVVVFVILVRRLRRRAAASPARVLLVAAVCVYGVGLLRSVLLPYPLVLGDARAELPPWPLLVQLVPLATVPEDPSGMLLNVLLFVPLGFLLPMLLRRPSLPRVTAAGLLVSLSIELVQLVGDLTVSTARIADVDDLIGNTAGTLLGFGVFLAVTRLPPVRRAAEAAAFHGSAAPAPREEAGGGLQRG